MINVKPIKMNLTIPRFEINRTTKMESPKRAMIVSAIVIFLKNCTLTLAVFGITLT